MLHGGPVATNSAALILAIILMVLIQRQNKVANNEDQSAVSKMSRGQSCDLTTANSQDGTVDRHKSETHLNDTKRHSLNDDTQHKSEKKT